MLFNYLIVAAGGALGAVLRYACGNMAALVHISGYVSTFAINIIGSFLLGLIAGRSQSGSWTLFASIGVCGSFTTFSTFSVQTMTLFQEGKILWGSLYAGGSLILGVASAMIGYYLARKY